MEHKKHDGRWADLRFILRGNKRGLAVLSMLSLLTAISEAFFLGAVVQAISALDAGDHQISAGFGPIAFEIAVTTLLALATLAALVRAALSGLVAFNGPRLAAASRERQRRRIFSAYINADWATQSAEKSGRLMQAMVGAVNEVNTVINLLAQALPALLTLIVLVAAAFLIDPFVTLCLVGLGVVIVLALRPMTRRARRAARADAHGRNATAAHVAGVLAAAAEITVLGSGRGVLDVGFSRMEEAERNYGRASGLKRLASTIGQGTAFIFVAAGLWLASVVDLGVDFTTFGTITILLLRGAGLAQQVQNVTNQYGAVAPFAEQVRTLIAGYDQRRRRWGEERFPATHDIALDGVSYTYPGSTEPSVEVAGTVFAAGSSVAVVGPSGSGKSTLIQLVLRLRQPTRGTVRIGGVPAGDIRERDFSAKVAYLPQSPHLVPGTIWENIAFFRPSVSRDDVVRAARMAQIHDDIAAMTDGYDTVLDSHVDSLSGGQKQRLALARALANRPAVLVLDEPTSALDAVSEAAVVETLTRLKGSTTVIMITHRMSTTTFCDEVLRLEHGQLRPARSSGIRGETPRQDVS